MYYAIQLGSFLRPFMSLKEMTEYFKSLTAVQRICCTLFDYREKVYAEGHDLESGSGNPWRMMP